MTEPYYADEHITLYHGDCREVTDWLAADVLVTDPPYGQTNLAWDRWPSWFPSLAATSGHISQLWCFGSLRMFLDNRDDFADWRLAQDVVWRKPRGRSTTTDRFARAHELVLHWYRGAWANIYHAEPRVDYHGAPVRATHRGQANDGTKVRPIAGAALYEDSGSRIQLSVIDGSAGDPRVTLHPTQKPLSLLEALIAYSCPTSGTIADPFAGSGSTIVAAKQLGRKAIGVEIEERYCEIAAKRLAQGVLDFGSAS